MDEHEAIVRDLAESGPFISEDGYDLICRTCGATDVVVHTLDDPANHKLECIWRRAVSLYPAAQEA